MRKFPNLTITSIALACFAFGCDSESKPNQEETPQKAAAAEKTVAKKKKRRKRKAAPSTPPIDRSIFNDSCKELLNHKDVEEICGISTVSAFADGKVDAAFKESTICNQVFKSANISYQIMEGVRVENLHEVLSNDSEKYTPRKDGPDEANFPEPLDTEITAQGPLKLPGLKFHLEVESDPGSGKHQCSKPQLRDLLHRLASRVRKKSESHS